MKHYFKRLSVLACVLVALMCLCAISVSSVDAISSVIHPSITEWTQDTSYFNCSTYEIKDDMIIIHNKSGNVFSLVQKVSVKPNTMYRLSAQVRMENYKLTESDESGATVLQGGIWDSTCWTNSFVTSSQWGKSSITFNSGENSSIKISLAVGMWSGACEGTAYFRDVTLEEIGVETKDNHWNILALIYRNIDTPEFKKSFSDSEVAELKRTLNNYPAAVQNLSDSRMLIDRVDTYVIDTPVRSISGSAGDLTTGENGDINFDDYLKDHDYQLIVVYAPLTGSPSYTGWGGLGGTWYEYDGRIIYYLTMCLVWDMNGDPFEVRGGHYDTDIAALLHEHLHCVETNSSFFNDWNGFTPVHNNADHGYVTTNIEWLDWYSALMRDDGLDGKGFKPRSFYVTHIIKSEEAVITGDLNGDGSINQKDLAMLSKYMRNQTLYPLDEYALIAADINGDGNVNQKDLAKLSKYMRNQTAYPLL